MKMKCYDINENGIESTKKNEGENRNLDGPRAVGYVNVDSEGKNEPTLTSSPLRSGGSHLWQEHGNSSYMQDEHR